MIMVSLGTLPVTPKLILVKGVGQFTQQQIHDYLLKCVKQFPQDYNDFIADAESVHALLFKNGVFRANLEAIKAISTPSEEELELIDSQYNDDLRLKDYFYEIDGLVIDRKYHYLSSIIYEGKGENNLQTKLETFISDNADEINHYQAEAERAHRLGV